VEVPAVTRSPARSAVAQARQLLGRAREDIEVVLERDPAARTRWEVLLYPHLHALWLHRVAHRLYRRERFGLARALSLLARGVSGIEIHPGARIGRRFFIDHGAGVVIGETAVVGDDVTLYHQVTLGSTGWRLAPCGPAQRRHPRLEDGVVVGVNASILGPVTIGAGSRVGAHAVVLRSLPPGSRVSSLERAAGVPNGVPANGVAGNHPHPDLRKEVR
jgi:serine O-acetyltransferase